MAAAWLQQMLTGEATVKLEQLSELQSELSSSLRWMLRPDVDISGILFETFSVRAPKDAPNAKQQSPESSTSDGEESSSAGESESEVVVPLCYKGESREVTQENKSEYVELLLQWHACYSAGPLLPAFLKVLNSRIGFLLAALGALH